MALLAAPAASAGGDIRIEEFQRSGANPNIADPGTRRLVLKIAHPDHTNHYGGQLQFGPDGMLYAGTGDGGGGGDPANNAQNGASLLGKLLRVDPSGRPYYSVPPGNMGGTPVYAYGLRNPFRFSFDRANGDIWIGDVGQQDREEINHVPGASLAGADFGWDCLEGTTIESGCDPGADYVPPVFEYPNPGGAAVTGGYVVRDSALTPLLGRYVYADFFDPDIRSFDPADPAGTEAATGLTESSIASFGEDATGRLHVVSLGGPVSRVTCGADCGDGVELVPAFSGTVDTPISVTASAGDTSRLFVTERGGRVRVAVGGVMQPTPFLDIASMVDTAGEGGLLSIALAPDYPASGRFYVYYVAQPGVTDPPLPAGDGGATAPPPAEPAPVGEPAAPPAAPAAADTAPPRLTVRVARRQRFLRLRRVVVRVRCSERCLLRASARTSVPGIRPRGALVRLGAGEARTLRILLSRRAVRRLARARSPRVRVALRARDDAGNLATAARVVRPRR